MRRSRLIGVLLLAVAPLLSACIPEVWGEAADAPKRDALQTEAQIAVVQEIPEPPPTKTVGEVLDRGVVITISLASQQMHVFRDGVLWRSSPVSTGKRGKETPASVFAILQKKRLHRSNLYSNAPMPFMQRLTWDGIAIHAGRLPGYPASHGCIRVPGAFASELFKITGPATTAVIIVDEPLASETEALALAQQSEAVVPISPELLQPKPAALARAPEKPAERLPAARTIPAPQVVASAAPAPALASPAASVRAPALPPVPAPTTSGGIQQTIQLAAALSPESAASLWKDLSARRPELQGMQMAVVPAMVNGKQYYRLRASAADAHATCKALKRAGIECLPIG